MDAIAAALAGSDARKVDLARSIGYLMFADRLEYFRHGQYDILFPRMKGQLRMGRRGAARGGFAAFPQMTSDEPVVELASRLRGSGGVLSRYF